MRDEQALHALQAKCELTLKKALEIIPSASTVSLVRCVAVAVLDFPVVVVVSSKRKAQARVRYHGLGFAFPRVQRPVSDHPNRESCHD
jgi:hypothetical protein